MENSPLSDGSVVEEENAAFLDSGSSQSLGLPPARAPREGAPRFVPGCVPVLLIGVSVSPLWGW